MLGWLRDNYKLGIRFHSGVVDPPCIFYSSGHRQSFSDSTTHHGNIMVFAGGPVGNESKEHVDFGDRGDDNMATTRVREKRGVPNSRNTRAEDYFTRDVIRANEAQTVRVSNKDNISGAHSKVISKQTWEFLVGKMSGYEPIFPYRPSL